MTDIPADVALRLAMKACSRCVLRAGCTQVVPWTIWPPYGHSLWTPEKPRWGFMAEAPGSEEDLAGEPLVGKAGRELNAMCVEAGLAGLPQARFNALSCRPKDNKLPARAQDLAVLLEACRPWVLAQLAILDLDLVVLGGKTACLSVGVPYEPGRKWWGQIDGDSRPRMWLSTHHPSRVLRQSVFRHPTVQHLRQVPRLLVEAQVRRLFPGAREVGPKEKAELLVAEAGKEMALWAMGQALELEGVDREGLLEGMAEL